MKILETNVTNSRVNARICAETLKKTGAVLLVPTETVYGLVCRASDKAAVERIYDLKKRSENKPLALFVRNIEMLESQVGEMPQNAKKLASAFCPGPITIIVPNSSGTKTGFRIPDHKFILELLEESGEALASTSANLSGHPAALNVNDAVNDLAGEPEISVDWGALPSDSIASTVVDVLADGNFKILRSGPIAEEMLEKALDQ